MKHRQRGFIELTLLALIVSIAANILLYRAMSMQKTRATIAETNLTTANAATKTCNDSIAGLEAAATARGVKSGAARERARQKALGLEQRAQQELSTPATAPGNDCKSAQDRVDRILLRRAERIAL